MIKLIDGNFSEKVWDEAANHPLQSWQWGEVRRKTGVDVVRVGKFSGNALTQVFQFTVHQLPLTKYKIGYLPRSIAPSGDIIEFLFAWCKKNNLIFLKLEPYEIRSTSKLLTANSKLSISTHQLFPDWTILLDLTPSEDSLFEGLKSKTRYNVRLAAKKGVSVKEMSTAAGFEIFSDLYFETTKRQAYFGHSRDYHKMVWEGMSKNIAHILVAFYQDIPLAAYELFIFKDKAYYPYGGSSVKHKNVMAPNLLMWEAIRFAKSKGCLKFDMWGAAAPATDSQDPYAGFSRFKEGYGGRYVELTGSYDLIINPFLYRLYSAVYKLRSAYLSSSLIHHRQPSS